VSAEYESAVAELIASINRKFGGDEAPASSERKRSRFKSAGGDVPMGPQTERPLVGSYHARGFITETVSASNVGKSQLIALETLAIVCERPDIVGETAPFRFPGGVVVITNEDGYGEFMSARNAIMKTHGLTVASIKHPLLVNDSMGVNVVGKNLDGSIGITPAVAEDLRDAMKDAGGIDLFAGIYVDTRAASFGNIEENSATDMGQAYAMLSDLAHKWNVFIDILTHKTKKAGQSTEDDADHHNSRGSTAATAGARYQRQLDFASAKDAPDLAKPARRDWVKVRSTKSKSGKVGADVRWFERHGVVLQTKAVHQPDASIVTPGTPDDIGILTFSATGPISPATIINDLLVVDAWEAKGQPLAVKPNNGRGATRVLGGKDIELGKRKVAALEKEGLIEKRARPGKGGTRHDVEEWFVTEAGRAAINERQAETLTKTDDE